MSLIRLIASTAAILDARVLFITVVNVGDVTPLITTRPVTADVPDCAVPAMMLVLTTALTPVAKDSRFIAAAFAIALPAALLGGESVSSAA